MIDLRVPSFRYAVYPGYEAVHLLSWDFGDRTASYMARRRVLRED
jgi:hypothetical protein